jgi:RNA polymerase sigma factor (sigma-70 family)
MKAAVTADRPLTVEAHLGLVYREVRHYTRRLKHLTLEDLVQEGTIGLMRGIELFNPAFGCRPSTYLTIWIRQAIRRALHNQNREIRLPCYVIQQRLQAKSLTPESLLSLDAPRGESATPFGNMLASDADVVEEAHARLVLERLEHAIEALENDQHGFVLRMRVQGRTLADIGGELGVSRERTRQLEKQAIELVRRVLLED